MKSSLTFEQVDPWRRTGSNSAYNSTGIGSRLRLISLFFSLSCFETLPSGQDWDPVVQWPSQSSITLTGSLDGASQHACKLGCIHSSVILVSWEIFLWHFGGAGWEPILENCWTHLIIITFFKYCIKALWSGLHQETLVLCPAHVWYSTKVRFKALIWLVGLDFG